MRFLWLAIALTLPFPLIAQEKRDKKKALFEPLPPIAVEKLERTNAVDFEKEVKPILENKCEVCHSGAIKEGRYDLSSYEALKKGGKSGAAVIPGKPEESLLIKLAGRTAVPPMPPKDDEPLTPKELAILKLWVAQGAKDSVGGTAKEHLKLGALPKGLRTISALALSSDKTILAVGQAGHIFLYEQSTGKLLRELVDPDLKNDAAEPLKQAQLDVVQALAISSDGKQLAAGGYQELTLWEIATGKIVRKMGGFSDRVVALDYSPDGKLLAAAGGPPTGDGELKLLEPATGRVVAEPKASHTDTILAVRFRPDGKLLATASADKFVKVFAVPDCQFQKSFEGHTHQVQDVDWRADGAVLVSAGADQTVKVWDYGSGDQIRSFNAHARAVTRLSAQRKQPWVFTASDDGSAKLWNIDNGQQLKGFGGATDVLQALAGANDGSLVATGGADGLVRVYNGATGQLTQTINVPK